MRVIAGTAKGRQLYAPKGIETRPITAKIKEALFNIWQDRIHGADFLDLFAGSGSIGIEALSRGADHVVFVDKSRKAVEIIKKNLEICGFRSGYNIYQDDVFRRIGWLEKNEVMFDIIYLDPPFTEEQIFHSVIQRLSNAKLLKRNGIFAIRTRREMEVPDRIEQLKKYKQKVYGISSVHFYGRAEE